MAIRRNKKKNDETLVDLVEARESASSFFERNQNLIFGILAAVVLIAGGIFAYYNYFQKPREERAMNALSQAQIQFERDSFALALQNPGGGNEGFLDILDRYSGTKAGNLANYYAGISWLNLGKYEAAIAHLKDFNAKGQVTPITKYGALGDAYSELGEYDKALRNYEKAAGYDNEVLAPYYLKKAGMLSEVQGNYQKALSFYQDIKENYPNSQDGTSIDKYIARVERLAGAN